MSDWPGAINAITLFVEDLEVSKEFYSRVFDVSIHFEDPNSAVYQFGGTLINLLAISEADELVGPASVGRRESGARLQFTLAVDDVNEKAAELIVRGIELLNGPLDRPWGIRTASFVDPDGYVWEIAH